MDMPNTPQTFGEMMQFFAQQNAMFQAQLREQIDAQAARFDHLASKPLAARKAEPPKYQGTRNEDLDLWFFTVEQYYSDYHPIMNENSPAFVNMVSCHLAPTPMNWYRQFVADCDRNQVVRTWATFKAAMRKRFLPPDNEYLLREKLCKLTQIGSLHDYVSAFQDVLIQCQVPISPLEKRFYFQQGLRAETTHHLREHHPATLDEAIDLALRFDHGMSGGRTPSATSEWVKSATCHKCRAVGHIAPNCPNQKR